MAETVILEATVGAALSKLIGTIENTATRACMFQNNLIRIKSNLLELNKMLDEVMELGNQIGVKQTAIEAFVTKLEGFDDVINECSNIQWWNCCLITRYAGRLKALEDELHQQFPFATFGVQHLSLMMTHTYVMMKDTKQEKQNSMPGNQGVSCAVPRPPACIVGFTEPLNNLKRELLEGTAPSLLLTAPGGCGKTTLVKMLCHDREIKGKFKDNIFFVCITKNPNKMGIVDKLLRRFNCIYPFRGDDDAMEDAIQQLELLLNEITDPKLLILDDVWLGSDHVINSFMFENIQDFKILVTSRATISRLAYKQTLEPLHDTDARTLFCYHSAVLQEGNLNDLQKDSIEKIVKGCGGFPIALKMIGESLRGEDASIWQTKADEWCSHAVFDSNPDLLTCLEKSLDFFSDDANLRDCFMDLGAFPVQKIPIAALIDIWAELHNLGEKKSIEIIVKIIARNLATLELPWKDTIKFDKYYSYNFMSQHGLLTELAIKQCNGESIKQRQRMIIDLNGNNHQQWPGQTQQPDKARLLSISTDEMFKSSWRDMDVQAPEVEVLILNLQSRNYNLPEFVQRMEKLRVLIVTNHGPLPVELGHFQLLDSGSLPYLKKIRLEKVSIPCLDQKNPIKLRSLKKISLFNCEIGEAFKSYTTKFSDVLPNLEEVNIACCKGMEEFLLRLCDIVNLKKLSITGSFRELTEGICKLKNLEVLRLRYCVDLSKLPDSITSLQELRILDISDCLRIGDLPEHIGLLCNLQELHMKGCFGVHYRLPQSITALRQLTLVTCDKEIAQLLEPIKESTLTNLRIVAAIEDFSSSWIPNHYF